ncbi:MAG: hypothetical protein ABI035_14325, partial [Gemmatimonadaceae bacterium]
PNGHITMKTVALLGMIATAVTVHAQAVKTSYPSMAPSGQYMMERNAEIALARSAAPPTISKDAEVMVLTRDGYDIAVKGSNGFVCMVERSWASGIDDPDFWNPKVRGPLCLNPPAVRSYLPDALLKSKLLLSGQSKTQMFAAIETALNTRKLPPMETGAMCYMLSKHGYLSGAHNAWRPHLMFFVPLTQPSMWGANLTGSPVIGTADEPDHLTIFVVPVARWSDGSLAPPAAK